MLVFSKKVGHFTFKILFLTEGYMPRAMVLKLYETLRPSNFHCKRQKTDSNTFCELKFSLKHTGELSNYL